MAKFFYFLIILALIGGAFYAGARFKDRIPFLAAPATAVQTPTPQPPKEEPFVQFEKARRQVDQDPQAWIGSEIGKELLASGAPSALESPNPEFLYLYGRASLLTGNADEAAKAFEAAIAKAELSPSPANATIKKDAILALSAVSLKTQKEREKVLLLYDEITRPASGTTP